MIIEEAIQREDRVLVMSHRPAAIWEIGDVDLPRSRDLDARAISKNAIAFFV